MGKASLDPDLREFLESLNSAGVKYLVVGGYAVNFHGHYRATDDLDVWIAVSPENAHRVSQVMRSFGGFSASTVPPSMFLQPRKAFIFGREPTRIDVLTGPSGVDFDECYSRRVDGILDGVKVSVISLDDLKANKRAAGRTKDIGDLENLPPVAMPAPKASARKRTSHRRRRG
jgi:hypothetical protein